MEGDLAFPACAGSQVQTRLSCRGSILRATPCDQACSGEMSTLNASFMILQSLHKLISPQYTSKHSVSEGSRVFVLTFRFRCFYRSEVWRTNRKSWAPVCYFHHYWSRAFLKTQTRGRNQKMREILQQSHFFYAFITKTL